jgi:hypothetical protein
MVSSAARISMRPEASAAGKSKVPFYEAAGVKPKFGFSCASLVRARCGRLTARPSSSLRVSLLPANPQWDRFSSRVKLVASLGGTPVRLGDAGDDLLSVSAFHEPMHLSLFSPTGDPSKPGTGTTLV